MPRKHWVAVDVGPDAELDREVFEKAQLAYAAEIIGNYFWQNYDMIFGGSPPANEELPIELLHPLPSKMYIGPRSGVTIDAIVEKRTRKVLQEGRDPIEMQIPDPRSTAKYYLRIYKTHDGFKTATHGL